MIPRRSKTPVLLYLLHCGNFYGTERMALATLAGFPDHRRVVIAPPPYAEESIVEASRKAGYETVTFESRLGLLRSLLPWFLGFRSIDVIGTGVVHNAVCHFYAKLFAVRVRQLHVAHGGTPEAFDQKHVLNRFPVTVVAVSRFVKQQLMQRGVRADSIDVIDNFLSDEQRAQGIERPAYGGPPSGGGRALDPERVRVMVVSRLDPIKRVDLLVQAIERHGLHEFEFDVYGVGTEYGNIKQRAAPLPNIRFHGYVGDVNRRLAQADLVLQLCPVEPFGLVVLEAFLARLVVIVPNSGGAGDLVEEGISGLRFEADDVDDLVRVLQRARAASAETLQRLADAGQVALATRFSQSTGGRRYREAIAAARPSRPA